jgi:hypothetical protein
MSDRMEKLVSQQDKFSRNSTLEMGVLSLQNKLIFF